MISIKVTKGHEPEIAKGIAKRNPTIIVTMAISGFGCKQLEPAARVELATDGLRNRCSTTELRWQVNISNYT